MTNRLRHLLLVTLEDPYNPRSWSGTPYQMRLALEKKVEKLSILANLKPKRSLMGTALRVLLGGKPPRYPLYLTTAAQRRFAQQTLRAIDELQPDAVLTISSHCVVRMGVPPVPTFMFSDSPWLSWKETYQEFDSMPILGPRFARLEAAAAQRLTGLVFASDWAVQEARRLYAAPPEKLHSIPLGASWTPAIDSNAVHRVIDERAEDRLALLYVGKDWERKGGPLAVQIALELRARGIRNVMLHVVGCTPEIAPEARDLVHVHGFLDAKDEKQSALLENLFLQSHFLVVPTRAECFGLVFAEAHAFGLPAVSRKVQALPSIVRDGETGILEDADAPAEAYVGRMLELLTDRGLYRRMAHAARARFETNFTWERFAERLVAAIDGGLAPR